MNFLQNIDWRNHDGVNLSMINDFLRNQFYDSSLKETVKDRHCIDVGFGTGLLTVLALQHGAKSVIAYESDQDRYHLGQEVIKTLGLRDRVTLFNDRYDYSMLDEHPKVEVLFTETVNGNLWWEGLFNNIPAEPSNIVFVPGQYFFELWAYEVPDTFAAGVMYSQTGPIENHFPGVDIDPAFVQLINEYIAITNNSNATTPVFPALESSLVILDQKLDTPWGWLPYQRAAVTRSNIVGSYVLDISKADITKTDAKGMRTIPFDFRASKQSLEVDTSPWKSSNVILVPRVGMRSGKQEMYLDTGHWGPVDGPAMLVKPTENLQVYHSVRSGAIKYQLG